MLFTQHRDKHCDQATTIRTHSQHQPSHAQTKCSAQNCTCSHDLCTCSRVLCTCSHALCTCSLVLRTCSRVLRAALVSYAHAHHNYNMYDMCLQSKALNCMQVLKDFDRIPSLPHHLCPQVPSSSLPLSFSLSFNSKLSFLPLKPFGPFPLSFPFPFGSWPFSCAFLSFRQRLTSAWFLLDNFQRQHFGCIEAALKCLHTFYKFATEYPCAGAATILTDIVQRRSAVS